MGFKKRTQKHNRKTKETEHSRVREKANVVCVCVCGGNGGREVSSLLYFPSNSEEMAHRCFGKGESKSVRERERDRGKERAREREGRGGAVSEQLVGVKAFGGNLLYHSVLSRSGSLWSC